jgi:predicted ABC-type ATPase
MPFVVMIAGPNGSGKTTLSRHIRDQGISLGQYINPDDIAAGLVGSYDERVREAQQIADQHRADYLKDGVSFTFETVMSHESKVEFFEKCRIAEFDTIL